MFTIKAIENAPASQNSSDQPRQESYAVYQAEQYRFGPTSLLSTIDGPPVPMGHFIEIDGEMTLYFGVGNRFERAYVMNDRGKTIDTIIG